MTPLADGYRRRVTREVRVGEVGIGGANPIRVQSMTTPATTDTDATVAQIVRLAEAGCEIARVTVPRSADAENLPNIRRELERAGVRIPLVADIHFTPAAAMMAVEHVDKVRINPGNFADKKRFAVREYSDAEYAAELERIERAFAPLVRRCRELGRSMRIGTNHGSLSDRIMNRYGDTPEGMVESALEFVRICEAHDYREIVLSMKASNPLVVLQAYRTLVSRMDAEGMDYPLHLGVTEAGDGEDARIKSAIGIGVLLDEGLGDTIRVSLTEDPVREIPVARSLVEPYNRRLEPAPAVVSPGEPCGGAPERRSGETRIGPLAVGGGARVAVEAPLAVPLSQPEALRRELDAQVGPRVAEDTRADLVSVRPAGPDELGELRRLRESLELLSPTTALSAELGSAWTEWSDPHLDAAAEASHRLHLALSAATGAETLRRMERLAALAADRRRALLVEADASLAAGIASRLRGQRNVQFALAPSGCDNPGLTWRRLVRAGMRDGGPSLVLIDRPRERAADPLLGPAQLVGGLLCDGIGDAVHVDVGGALESRRLAFGILQAARVRITRTDFISCPSCGRTMFDLESTTARIKARTSHLKNVRIAVMGCVVNGPGEMADADFGYVGWGEDRIALFVGKEMVAKDIPTEKADDRLVELIKAHGMWVDPPVGAPG